MTFSTSLVAVCCSSDSVSSRVARLQLLEQPHVLDGDHRLVGEGLEQPDLPVGERLDLASASRRSRRSARPPAASARPGRSGIPARAALPASGDVRLGSGCRGCGRPLRSQDRAADDVSGVGTSGCTRRTTSRASAVTPWSAAKWTSSPSNRRQHASSASHSRAALSTMASKTGWRSVGELEMTAQDLRGRRLLLQRLGQLAIARLQLLEQPHVLDRDHRLVGEGLQQLDLLVGERAGLSSANVDGRRSAVPPAASAPSARFVAPIAASNRRGPTRDPSRRPEREQRLDRGSPDPAVSSRVSGAGKICRATSSASGEQLCAAMR